MGSNAKSLTKDSTVIGNENIGCRNLGGTGLFKSRERSLSSFCYAFTAANTVNENEETHTLRVKMAETKTRFSLLTV